MHSGELRHLVRNSEGMTVSWSISLATCSLVTRRQRWKDSRPQWGVAHRIFKIAWRASKPLQKKCPCVGEKHKNKKVFLVLRSWIASHADWINLAFLEMLHRAQVFSHVFCSPFHLWEVSRQIAAFVTDFVLKSIIGGAGQPWCLEMARCRIRGGTSSWAMCAQTFAHLCTLRAPLCTHTHTLAPPPNSYLAADQRTLWQRPSFTLWKKLDPIRPRQSICLTFPTETSVRDSQQFLVRPSPVTRCVGQFFILKNSLQRIYFPESSFCETL